MDMKGKVMTVLGPIKPEELGVTMTHEHLLIDLDCNFMKPNGASQIAHINEPVSLENLWWVRQNPISNRDALTLTDISETTKEVMEFKRYGGSSMVDVTNIGIGRDPTALRDISSETGINVIMGAGYYVALSHKPDMDEKSEDEIAEEIIRDVTKGVGETDIRSGIIGEIGVSDILKNRNEEKSLRAAVMAQKATGAPLTIHQSIGEPQGGKVIEVLEEEGADLNRVIMSHTEAHLDETMEYTFMLADAGLYVEYDLWGFDGDFPDVEMWFPSDTQRVKGIEKLIQNGYLDQLLLSQDVCNKIMTMAYGGFGRAHILRDIIPLFRHAGITEEEIKTMLVDNPKRILEFV